MGLRNRSVTITAEGRDKGKTFEVTEMNAWDAEDWATRAMLMLVKSGSDIPQETLDSGMSGLISLLVAQESGGMDEETATQKMSRASGLVIKALSGVSNDELRVLKDELLRQIVFIPNPAKPTRVSYPLFKSQVEEIRTIWRLHKEAFEVTSGFSLPAVDSTSKSGTRTGSRNTKTSTGQ